MALLNPHESDEIVMVKAGDSLIFEEGCIYSGYDFY